MVQDILTLVGVEEIIVQVMIVDLAFQIKIIFKDIVTIAVVTISIFGCKTSPENPSTFLNVPENKIELSFEPTGDNNEKKIPLDHIFKEDDIEFISLKPNSEGEGLLVLPIKFYSINENWLAYDPRNNKSSVLLFDHDGNFKRYIGTKGKGPGEYIATSLCRVNQKNKRIEIFDGATNLLLLFTYDGAYIKSIDLPMIFTDFIPDPYNEGYYLYTLDNYNTAFMPKYSLEKDFVITKTDSLFQPLYGIEEITLNPNSNPYRNNGNKLFQYGSEIGFINNYSNDLYLIQKNDLESLISFDIDGMEFQPKYYIKNPDGNRFLNTLEKGYSFVSDLSISENRLFQNITVSSSDPDRKYDKVYLYYDFNTSQHVFYSTLEDSSNTYTIHEFYLDPYSSSYDAFAMIRPKDIEDMDENNHPTRHKILSMLKENNNNPIIARLKFK